MTIYIEVPQGADALKEFVLFHDRVYESRSARWPAALDLQLPILTGDSPFVRDRQIHPLLAREGSTIIGATSAEQFGNTLAAAGRPLPPDVLAACNEVSKEIQYPMG